MIRYLSKGKKTSKQLKIASLLINVYKQIIQDGPLR